MIPETFWVINCGRTSVLVDLDTYLDFRNLLRNTISDNIEVTTIYGNKAIIIPSKVECIYESTLESRKLLYQHKMQERKDWLSIVMEDNEQYTKEEKEVSEVLEEHGLEEAPE